MKLPILILSLACSLSISGFAVAQDSDQASERTDTKNEIASEPNLKLGDVFMLEKDETNIQVKWEADKKAFSGHVMNVNREKDIVVQLAVNYTRFFELETKRLGSLEPGETQDIEITCPSSKIYRWSPLVESGDTAKANQRATGNRTRGAGENDRRGAGSAAAQRNAGDRARREAEARRRGAQKSNSGPTNHVDNRTAGKNARTKAERQQLAPDGGRAERQRERNAQRNQGKQARGRVERGRRKRAKTSSEELQMRALQLRPDEIFLDTSDGLHVVLKFDEERSAFTGRVSNTSDKKVERVRVNLSFLRSYELGPTPPYTIAAETSQDISLKANSDRITSWTVTSSINSK